MLPIERIEERIFHIRGRKIILDKDLADVYGVENRALKQAIRRNSDRFPADFVFELTPDEVRELSSQTTNNVASRSQFVILKRGQNAKYLPFGFTEHGAIMAASVLNSPRAIEMSVFVVRAFVKLRQAASENVVIAGKLAQIENKLTQHDGEIKAIIDAIRELMSPKPPARRKIGFRQD